MIYYAGHGFLDKFDTGFWIPVDGGKDMNAQQYWIPNAQIRNFITKINARSVVLISDSCFSGDLLEASRGVSPTIDSAYFRNALRYTAKQVLTSGSSEAVPDESEFAREFKAVLRNNAETCIDPIAMYDRVRRGVTKTMPLFGTLPGNQTGGSFVLFLRQAPQQQAKIASLILDGIPLNAQVRIIGTGVDKQVESRDATRIDSLPLGTYSVHVSYPLWKTSYSTELEINGEGEIHQSIPTGWIEFASLPPHASLTLERQRFDAVTVSETATSPPLLADTYTLSISAPYVQPVSMRVEVQAGKATVVSPTYNAFGILAMENPSPTILTQVAKLDGEVLAPSPAQNYSLKAGEYIVRARPSDDSDWSWKGNVSIQNGKTVSYQIPKEASEHSVGWRINTEQAHLASLQINLAKSHTNLEKNRSLTKASFITGGVSAIAAGILYFLGNSTMTKYQSTTNPNDAQSLHSALNVYNVLFISSLSVSGAWLGLGGVLIATTPNQKKINEQVQGSIENLRKLEAEKIAKGIEG